MTSTPPPMCMWCRHLEPELWACRAYPDGIPNALDMGQADHRLPLPGDNGVRFSPLNDEAAREVAEVWGDEPEPYMGELNIYDPSAPVTGPG